MANQGKNGIDVILAESLKELSKTRPIEKITIKEITDKAGVIRPTFRISMNCWSGSCAKI